MEVLINRHSAHLIKIPHAPSAVRNDRKGCYAKVYFRAYPRFGLTGPEINALIEEEILAWCEVVETGEEIRGVCRDRGDDIFLSCAVAAGADAIVSGDRDLLDLGAFRGIPILSVAAFEK